MEGEESVYKKMITLGSLEIARGGSIPPETLSAVDGRLGTAHLLCGFVMGPIDPALVGFGTFREERGIYETPGSGVHISMLSFPAPSVVSVTSSPPLTLSRVTFSW